MDMGRFLKGLSDRQALVLKYVVSFVLLIVFVVGSYNVVAKKKAVLLAKERELGEFRRLMKKFSARQEMIGPIKKRLAASRGASSPVTVMEEIGARIGIKDKLQSFKAVEESIEDGYEIKSVEVDVKDITLNQFVNLIYEIDRYPGLVLIKELDVNTGFEDNKKLDCAFKVLLIREAA